jgi:hypothetical protein
VRTCDDHRFKGWFHLPETPGTRVPGIFTWRQEQGANLELIGGLSPRPEYRQVEDEATWETNQIVGDIPRGTIYGETDAGR